MYVDGRPVWTDADRAAIRSLRHARENGEIDHYFGSAEEVISWMLSRRQRARG